MTIHRLATYPAGVFRTSPLRKGLYVQNQAFREPCCTSTAAPPPRDRIALTIRDRIAKFKVYSVRTE
jgi:hypothetical protein